MSETERIDRLERDVANLREGLLVLTAWLTQVPDCLGQHEYEPLRKIVDGEVSPAGRSSDD